MTSLYSERVVLRDGPDLRVVCARIDVEGARIARVLEQDRATFEASPAREQALDLGDKLVTPAFVDGHTHLAMIALRGIGGAAALAGNVVEDLYFRVERNLEPGDIRAFARLGAVEGLLSGTATFVDHYYGGDAVARALHDVGACGIVACTLQDVDGPGVPHLERELAATLALDDDLTLREAGVVAALGPHATDTVSAGLWERILALAEARDLPVHLHVAQSLDEVERSWARHGCDPVARLEQLGVLSGPRVLLVHLLFAGADALARLDPSRHLLGYCPWSQSQYAFPARIAGWLEAGLPWTLGTDAAACNDSVRVQQELRLVAAGPGFATSWGADAPSGGLEEARRAQARRQSLYEVQRRLSDPSRLLASVWDAPGALHPRLPVGRIAAGARANLAVWDTEHPSLWPATDPLRALCFGDVGDALHGLLVSGRWLGSPGEVRRSLLESDDVRAWRTEARERLVHLQRRAGLA